MNYFLVILVFFIAAMVVFNVHYVPMIITIDLANQQPILEKESFVWTRSNKMNDEEKDSSQHRLDGLNCDIYGGPSEEVAKEMVYWRDIPSDSEFTSQFANYGVHEKKYLTFEPDEGGWNNIRMSMETAVALAHAMGRTLVLPPAQNIYLLRNDGRKNRFTFKDFFHFDSIAEEHAGVEVITMKEFLELEVMTGNFIDAASGQPARVPENRTDWDGHIPTKKKFWLWLRNASGAPKWDFDKCVVGLASKTGPEESSKMHQTLTMAKKIKQNRDPRSYTDKPVPVNASPEERLAEMLGNRKEMCLYGDHFQNAKVMHFMGDNASGARLLVHFYAYLYFQDWHQDLLTKRFMRDHLRYIDEIQCAAARIVNAVRQKAKENGSLDGVFDTFHIRRGDFQYKDTRVDADVIYENTKGILVENSTIFIATDEKNLTFFDHLRKHYNLLFLHDFEHLITGVNKNYYGMLDQLVASRGRTFSGAYYSTFTGYINRIRGYHSQKLKLPGHELGQINSYFYIPKYLKDNMNHYMSLQPPLWGREFPVAWRDIDHDVEETLILS
jgi:hypothetical protein